MNLKLSKVINPNFFFFAVVFDVLILLIIFFLLGFSFVLQSGVKVDVSLPNSNFTMHPIANPEIFIITPGIPTKIFYKGIEYNYEEFNEKVHKLNSKYTSAILKADKRVPFGDVFKISELLLNKGFELSYATNHRENNLIQKDK